MKLNNNPPIHLTYCLNVHPGETWQDNLQAIKEKACAVRDLVAPDTPFGLGLRLSHIAADTLSNDDELSNFKRFLAENNLYVFTINGFPYGTFHGDVVKEQVYAPDWRTEERLNYTIKLADIMAELLPDDVSGSISTSPGSYKDWITSEANVTAMIENLCLCAAHLDNIYKSTGKLITLGLEPEPDCYIETTAEAVEFFERLRYHCPDEAVTRHIGICFDTCHLALQFEDLTESIRLLQKNDICISKFQISSALKAYVSKTKLTELRDYFDSTYLHQTRIRDETGITAFSDLTEDVVDLTESIDGELLSHFHVPLYFEKCGPLESTINDLTPEFMQTAIQTGTPHFEIETYTFDVLPESAKKNDITESIAAEYQHVLALI